MNQELRKHIIELLDKGTRLDGRKPDEYRKPIKIDYHFSKNAEGSARVQIGETVVLTGVKMSLEKPYPDTPKEGCLMAGAELLPMSNPEFESGPPGNQATELARVVDRGIRESHAIDMEKLCIVEGEKAWGVNIDICSMNDAGNLFDVSALSTMAALKDVKLPKLVDNEMIDFEAELTNAKLPLVSTPLSVTVCKIGNHFIVDPITDEEKVIDARLTVASDDKGRLVALQKGGETPLSVEEIDKMVELGIEKAKELRKQI